MRHVFVIRAWSAVAPGLQDASPWQPWALPPKWPGATVDIDLSHIPAMARRRLGPLARWVIAVADAVVAQAAATDLPVVWASRYGDAEKSLALLQAQAAGEALSPTAFGLSVHNGIGAQHSILRGMRANAISVASSDYAPEAGVTEALGLLHEGAPQVMLVCYDAPLPAPYADFHGGPQAAFAWAVLLALAVPGESGFTLQAQAPAVSGCRDAEAGQDLPHGLRVLQFLLQDRPASMDCLPQRAGQGAAGRWRWERTHA